MKFLLKKLPEIDPYRSCKDFNQLYTVNEEVIVAAAFITRGRRG